MRRLILAAALTTALAACNNAAEEPAADDTAVATETPAATEASSGTAATEASTGTAGTYAYEMDGKATTSVLMPDGTYQDSQDGKVVEKGLWAEHDGKVCFDPEGDETPGQCFATTEPDADGMFTATSDDGQTVLKIKKTA
jgi:hypothetical protein